ncbi:MAG: 50S ribosomal protein L6 [Candidatus Magasanikbacteria bacterium]|nr:50S ribosomal protein L6 [Candidatus Magasanikbacteria bacterium]
MSRVGKIIRTIPSGVTVEIKNGEMSVSGPKGKLSLAIHPRVSIINDGNALTVSVVDENNKKDCSLWGTFSSLIENLFIGVTEGFKRELEINGVGFKVALKGTGLGLEVGFSHSVVFEAPEGITFKVEKNIITVEGIDKQLVGETAAQIRRIRKPEPYKGKGIRYVDEVVLRKAGKTAAKIAK